MTNRSRMDRPASVVIMAAAVIVAAAVVYRAFRPARAGSATSRPPAPMEDAQWRNALGAGIFVSGSREAPVTIVELTDLECPACRGFATILDDVVVQRAGAVRLLYVPHPLTYHRFAMAAAKGAECAADLGGLAGWISAVYRGQDSLGLRSWGSYAAEAGIADTGRISDCARSAEPSSRVEEGLAIGTSLGSVGTPTVLVNQLRFFEPPDKAQLNHAIDQALKTAPSVARVLTAAGMVLDSATSGPLGGATVALLDPAGAVVAHAASDSGGAFELQSANGRYRMRVTRDGYNTFVSRRLNELRGVLPPSVIFLAQAGR